MEGVPGALQYETYWDTNRQVPVGKERQQTICNKLRHWPCSNVAIVNSRIETTEFVLIHNSILKIREL